MSRLNKKTKAMFQEARQRALQIANEMLGDYSGRGNPLRYVPRPIPFPRSTNSPRVNLSSNPPPLLKSTQPLRSEKKPLSKSVVRSSQRATCNSHLQDRRFGAPSALLLYWLAPHRVARRGRGVFPRPHSNSHLIESRSARNCAAVILGFRVRLSVSPPICQALALDALQGKIGALFVVDAEGRAVAIAKIKFGKVTL